MSHSHKLHTDTHSSATPTDSAAQSPSSIRQIMNTDEIRRALIRISHEILERTNGAENTAIIGLYRGGSIMAQRLGACIARFEQREVFVGAIDFSPFRDDAQQNGPFPLLGPTVLPPDITGKTIILVDDVINTGRSMRAALSAILTYGRPARIQCAALVDRGHREMPIRAEYVGKNTPTSRQEWIVIHFTELDGSDEALLMRREEFQ